MKNTLIVLLSMTLIFVIYFSNSKISSHEMSMEHLKKTLSDLQNQSDIVFIGPNSWNGAWYSINISCTNGIPYGLEHLPEDKAVEVVLKDDCKNKTVPPDTLEILTNKRFSYVYWDMYFQGVENVIYKLNETEAKKIANAPWEYIAITGFDTSIGKILRDTKNTVRKGYEPTGNPEIYTPEDKEKCDSLWGDGLEEGHEKEWKIQSEKVLECYRNLPLIQ